MSSLDFHADDYATSPQADKDFIELLGQGRLDSFSIMPNMSCWDQSLALYKKKLPSFPFVPKISIHLNFMEGHACADPLSIPLLVDANGIFKLSWGDLFKISLLGSKVRKLALKRQLMLEIIAQTQKVISSGMVNIHKLRFDSHQHTHMIPLVFDALLAAIDQEQYEVEYIRNSVDPLSLYVRYPHLYTSYSGINIIKCCLLNYYARRVAKLNQEHHLPTNILCGVMFSGKMDLLRLRQVIDGFSTRSQKKQCVAEILFHPGMSVPDEIGSEFSKQGFIDFHLSKNRHIEKYALQNRADI